ncbi:hypothetical protein GCM10027294_52720 [Marinactinospora endophytica]
MRADDRVLLIDVENVLGSRPRNAGERLAALLADVGPLHHAVAGYAAHDPAGDLLASVLAELGIAPLRVLAGADAADRGLIAHARYVHDQGGRNFVVASADGRFAEVAALGRLEVLVRAYQPVAARLAKAANRIRRLGEDSGESARGFAPRLAVRDAAAAPLIAGVAAGATAALGHRLLNVLLPSNKQR